MDKSKDKHTPGPWVVETYEAGTATHYIKGPNPLDEIAAVYAEDLNRLDEDAANARLIAAAPDLLEQLLYVTRVLEAAIPDSTETLRAECLKLIAKARGES